MRVTHAEAINRLLHHYSVKELMDRQITLAALADLAKHPCFRAASMLIGEAIAEAVLRHSVTVKGVSDENR